MNEDLWQEKKFLVVAQPSFHSQPWRVDFYHPSSSTPLMFCCTGLRLDNFFISKDEASSGKTGLHVVDFHQARFLPTAFLELDLCQVVCAMPIYSMIFPKHAENDEAEVEGI